MTIPDRPQSNRQRYRLTAKGNDKRARFVQTLGRPAPEVTPGVTPEVRLAQVMVGEMTRRQLQRALGLRDDEHFRRAYLQPALEAGLIEMTIPDKPQSSMQRYRLTTKGTDKRTRNAGSR